MKPAQIILDYNALKEKMLAHKVLGHKIVFSLGSWDMLHIGHVRYLNRAKEYGDILVVGVDSDRGIKLYKHPLRPIIPQEERMEMLSYQNPVDYVTLVDDIDERGQWQCEILKIIPIDALVAVMDSYNDEQLNEIKQYCQEVIVLPRQAENTSSTDIIQGVVKKHLLEMLNQFRKQ